MTLPMNERDLIDLNAYLDGELTDQEQAAFEVRLAHEAALREELRALRATVAILQMAEPVRAPRNFTLDSAVYGKPRKESFWDRLSTPLKVMLPAGAAILATLVCVGIVILATGKGGLGAGAPMVGEQPSMQMAAEEPAAEEPSAERMADQAPEAEAQLAEPATEGGANAAGEAAGAEMAQPAEPSGGGGAPPEDGAAEMAAPDADTGGADTAEQPQPLEAPVAAEPMEETADEVAPTLVAPSDDQQFAVPSPTSALEVGQAEEMEEAQPEATITGPATQVPPRLLTTGVVIGLAVAALVIVLLVGLTLVLSRRRR